MGLEGDPPLADRHPARIGGPGGPPRLVARPQRLEGAHHDDEGLVAAQLDQRLMEPARQCRRLDQVVDAGHGLLLQGVERGDHGLGPVAAAGAEGGAARLDLPQGPGHVRDVDPAGGQHHGEGVGDVGGRGAVDDGAAHVAAAHGDETLGLQDAHRLTQGRLADGVGGPQLLLLGEQVAVLEVAAQDPLPEAVGDQLRQPLEAQVGDADLLGAIAHRMRFQTMSVSFSASSQVPGSTWSTCPMRPLVDAVAQHRLQAGRQHAA